MTFTMEQYRASAQAIRARLGGFTPKVAMILGSGLGFLGDEVQDPVAVDYHDIPYFKASTAPGHRGRLVFGVLEGRNVAVMQGRMHHYEGYSYEEVVYAVRVLRLLGCETLVVTNAAGGLAGGGPDAHHRPDQAVLPVPPAGGESAGVRRPLPRRLPPVYPPAPGIGPADRQGAGHPPAGGRVFLLLRSSV